MNLKYVSDVSRVVGLALLAASCQKAPSDASPLLVYTAGNAAEVFDLQQRRFYSVDANGPIKEQIATTEFSGPLDSCDTSAVFCIGTGLILAIPRDQKKLPRWEANKITCVMLKETASGYAAECRYGVNSITRFQYSLVDGVTSYTSICSACAGKEFRLRGNKGLFSAAP